MKIIFIASRSLSNIGGIETYMDNLCPNLAKKGHSVILYAEGDFITEKLYKGFIVYSYPSIKNRFLNKISLAWKATLHMIKNHRDADIIHYNAFPSALLAFIPMFFGKKIIYQGHGFEWQRAKWSKKQQIVIKYLDYLCLKFINNITMVSENQSKYVRDKYKKDVVTITPGINIPTKGHDKNILNIYNITVNKYILYLGRLVPEKKADVLIEAYQLLKNCEKKLVIAGDDPFEKEFINLCKDKAKNNENIIFTGAVYGKDKEALLENCYAFCIPSELEGLPITLLEAMSYAKPCIASAIPANKEALNSNGIYFETNNIKKLSIVLKEAISNETELIKIAEENYKRVKQYFTWDIIAEQYEAFCMSIKK